MHLFYLAIGTAAAWRGALRTFLAILVIVAVLVALCVAIRKGR